MQLRQPKCFYSVDASGAEASGGMIELRWRDGGKAPSELYGEVAVVDGGVAYT